MDRPSYLPPPTRWIIRIHQLTATISLRRMHATRLLIHEGTKTGGGFSRHLLVRLPLYVDVHEEWVPPPLGRFSFQRRGGRGFWKQVCRREMERGLRVGKYRQSGREHIDND